MRLVSVRSYDLPETKPLARRGRPKRALLPVILNAAAGLFAQYGFEQPTMDQVAKAAGVTKATLYFYFKGKSVLINAVVDQWLCEMPVIRPVNKRLTLRKQLINVGLQLRTLDRHPAVVSLGKRLASVEELLPPQYVDRWRCRYSKYEELLSGLMEEHCDHERPMLIAQQFMLLVIGDLGSESAALRIPDAARIESAVDLMLRVDPGQSSKNG